jgi:hypothetical protein
MPPDTTVPPAIEAGARLFDTAAASPPAIEAGARLFDTAAASEWLAERGIRRSPQTLRKLRCLGGGPRFRLLNRRPYYTEADLAQWIADRLSAPLGSTSEADPAGRRRSPKAGSEPATTGA